MNKVAILLGIGISQHGLPLTKADLAVATAECSIYKHSDVYIYKLQNRPVRSPFDRIPFTVMISQPHRGRVIHQITSITERTVFCSTWNRCLLWIDLPSTQLGFYQNYYPWTSSMPHPPLYSTQHCLASSVSLYRKKTKKYDSGSVFIEFTSLCVSM